MPCVKRFVDRLSEVVRIYHLISICVHKCHQTI